VPDDVLATQAWRAARTGLAWRVWDGDAVVFNPLTGHTHLLDAFAAQILTHVGEMPTTAGAVAGRLEQEVGLALAPEVIATVEPALERLSRLGLVERVEAS
jgi:PqqD family protein of HPr-rel-A system